MDRPTERQLNFLTKHLRMSRNEALRRTRDQARLLIGQKMREWSNAKHPIPTDTLEPTETDRIMAERQKRSAMRLKVCRGC